MPAPRAARPGRQPAAPGSAAEITRARGGYTPDGSAIPGIVDGWMTLSRNGNGPISVRLRLGGKDDGTASGGVIEVVVQPTSAASIAAIFAPDTGAVDAPRGDDRSSSAWVPCRVGISRRLNQGGKSPSR